MTGKISIHTDREEALPFLQNPLLLITTFQHHHSGRLKQPRLPSPPSPNGNEITVSSVYISPSNPNTNLINDIETLFALGHSSFLYGDFNAHHISWGGKFNNQRENTLNLIDNTDMDLLAPHTPNRFGHGSASIIDFALSRNIDWRSQIMSLPELSSDHNPIIINFDTTTQFNFPTRNVSTNWELFRNNLNHTITFTPNTANTREDIEKQVANLTDKILHAHTTASKPITTQHKRYVSEELNNLFIQRNRARKVWQFTCSPRDKRLLNNLQNKIHRKVRSFTNKNWENTLNSLDTEDGSLWGMSKVLRKKRTPVSALKGPTGIALSDSDKAETLACSLESQFQDNIVNEFSTRLTGQDC
ncbi:probable RNA-directed DNA polymerase from transposon X-element [Trichonephila clavipes]|nr:probable RNA-directed DNA polymerase from transposon X-element [Trichonephila clavipes]